jgi:hypothetical protein
VGWNRKGNRVIQMIVFGAVGCIGLAFLYIGLNELVAQRRALANAVAVEAEILSSGVTESRSADTDTRLLRDNSTTSYTSDVRFRYTVAGRMYESDMLRPTVIVQGHGSRRSAEEEILAFPAGAKVSAWVDPATPERGFLVKEGFAGPMVFTILGLVLPVIGWLASRLV